MATLQLIKSHWSRIHCLLHWNTSENAPIYLFWNNSFQVFGHRTCLPCADFGLRNASLREPCSWFLSILLNQSVSFQKLTFLCAALATSCPRCCWSTRPIPWRGRCLRSRWRSSPTSKSLCRVRGCFGWRHEVLKHTKYGTAFNTLRFSAGNKGTKIQKFLPRTRAGRALSTWRKWNNSARLHPSTLGRHEEHWPKHDHNHYYTNVERRLGQRQANKLFSQHRLKKQFTWRRVTRGLCLDTDPAFVAWLAEGSDEVRLGLELDQVAARLRPREIFSRESVSAKAHQGKLDNTWQNQPAQLKS